MTRLFALIAGGISLITGIIMLIGVIAPDLLLNLMSSLPDADWLGYVLMYVGPVSAISLGLWGVFYALRGK